jgi:RNA-splicing ligase RtcB
VEDWREALRDDVVLFVSAGEDFVDVKREESKTHCKIYHMEAFNSKLINVANANSECPIHVLAQSAPVEDTAFTQLRTTAHTLPGIVYAVGQPDLCPGNKYPVGAVFASRGWVHPPLIGSDIGCGMAWYKTRLSRSQVDGDRGQKIAEKLRGLEEPWHSKAHRGLWLQDEAGSCAAGEEWDRAVGTIGAGNHFAEIQVVESDSVSAEENPGHKVRDELR